MQVSLQTKAAAQVCLEEEQVRQEEQAVPSKCSENHGHDLRV
jgi:hypothetical protein